MVNKVKVPFEFYKRREGDVCKLVANNSKAKNILNWNPAGDLPAWIEKYKKELGI